MNANDRKATDYLTWRVPELLSQFDDVELARRPRCAETIAGELVGYCLRHDVPPGALGEAIGVEVSPGACGVLTAAAQMTRGLDRITLAQHAADLREDLPGLYWLDHIGAARPTGRAARDDTFDEMVAWMIEFDDRLDRYCLVTASDLRRDILTWVGPGSSLHDEVAETPEEVDRALTMVRFDDAVDGVRAALGRPAMFGVTTTDEAFGTWARWRLWSLERPDLVGPEPVQWSETPNNPGSRATQRVGEGGGGGGEAAG